MDNLTKTDEIFFSRTALDRNRAEAIVRDALAGRAPMPVAPEAAREVLRVIQAARIAHTERRVVQLGPVAVSCESAPSAVLRQDEA